jgi:predicted nucleic acid-binding protein
MGSRNRLTDPAALVGDTSAIINLNATGCARDILRAVPKRLVVVDVVAKELDRGRGRGRTDADMLDELVAEKLIEIVSLDDVAEAHFEKLVIGPAAETMDDGEAATIAYAAAAGIIAVIDERKATRLSAHLFPKLRIRCTVDILSDAEVRRSLGATLLVEAVFRALTIGRMRVLPQHVRWVVDLIGPVRAAQCPSLPKAVRQVQQNISHADVRSKHDAG